MSRHGVTFWHLSENFFTPLLQWQQEFQQFLSIIKIRTFAVFRVWKGFKVWEKTVKWKKQADAKAYLSDHLLFAIPALARAILVLRSELVNLQHSNFINNAGNKLLTKVLCIELLFRPPFANCAPCPLAVIDEWHPFYYLEVQMKVYEKLTETFRDFRSRTRELLCKTY